MNETNKTLTFLGVAAAACIAAYLSQPQSAEIDVESEVVGKPLTKAFDVEKAGRMKITRFDEEAAALSTFEVAQDGRLWTIPSKGGYPADAQSQMAEAVNGVLDREILSVVTSNPAEHPQYGVVDPESPKLDVGQTGVGARVTVTGEGDAPLVDLIIGHEVKDADGLHYVRRANQDFVYVVKINPEDFSTTFEDWIEDDLLKISPWDIAQVRLNDYTAEMFMTPQGLGVETDYKSDLTLGLDDGGSNWAPVSLKEATDNRRGEFQEFSLEANQELNADKLGDLKNALDDLRIVDVSKKPAGLSADLKAGEDFMGNNEALLSLIQRGFAPVGTQDGARDLLASSGEVIVTMKDGVEYVLRFGNPQVEAGDAPAAGAKGEAADADSDADSKAVNRYLFVMARFNEDAIEKPELEDVPALPDGASDGDAEPTDNAAEDAEGDDAEGDIEGDAEEPSADEAEPTEELIAQRKEIELRNQQKLDEYADQIKAGKDQVQALNDRFGDWYYVISNDVFKKVHLSREDVIQAKEGGDEADADAGPLGGATGAIPGMPNFGGLSAPPAGPAVEEPTEEPAATTEEPAEEPSDAGATAAEPTAEEPASEEAAADAPEGEQPS